MKHISVWVSFILFLSAGSLLNVATAWAQSYEQNGKLKIHVEPKQAYVFVDGKAIREGSQTIALAAGDHQVEIRNYGYQPKTVTVHITAGKTAELRASLEPSGDKVSGPFGDIEIKGPRRAAVLLNGNTPDYFVGHVDEFDWNWLWHQRLLVHPGTYQVNVKQEGRTIWSGPVTVNAGQQVTVYLDKNGATKTKDWPEGKTLPPQPRFHAGVASSIVPIAPVSAQLTALSPKLGCGQSTQLDWKSANAVEVSITNLGNVVAKGGERVTPTKTTAYELVAKGPGGEATQTATVNVNAEPTATLSLSQPEIHYHKIGDKVVEDGTATLNWSTTNASKVTIASLGNEPLSGSQTIKATPEHTSLGPISEDVRYNLSASNACGGTTRQTAVLHVVGSIDPAPPVTLASVFYPTDYPTRRHPKIGLVTSEQQVLAQAVKRIQKHEQYASNVNLMVVGHADVRGSRAYNMNLSQRRADAVKKFLEAKGITSGDIQTRAEGKDQELSQAQVAQLQSKDAQKPGQWMTRKKRATWLAYNRRVDIILEPSGQQSTEAYPNDVADTRILWQRPEPSLKKVEWASSSPAPSSALHASLARH